MDLFGYQSIINGDCSCIFPYMANNVLRSATGHGKGRSEMFRMLQGLAGGGRELFQ